MTKKTAIIFVADRNFLVPTILAMTQICNQSDVMQIADVFLFTTDADDSVFQTVSDIVRDFGVSVIRIDFDRAISENPSFSYRETHVPVSALGRFFTGNHIPESYRNIVYMDGDTQVIGPIFDLANAEIPEGKILAGIDRLYIKAKENDKSAKATRDYLAAIGVHNEADYFNSGVLACTRTSWITFCNEALDYFLKNSEKCRFHDQSALNAVCVGKRLPMSPKYNFVTVWSENGFTPIVRPSIIHFTGAEKPWFSKARPWKGRFIASYDRLIRRYPALMPFLPVKSAEEQRKTDQHADRMWWLTRLITPWRVVLRKRWLMQYLKQTRFFV